MKTKIIILNLIILVAILTSCSKYLVGTWRIEKYETLQDGKPTVMLYNIGTLKFDYDGTGRKNVNYLNNKVYTEDHTQFTWKASDSSITIKSEGSEMTKKWTIVENKKRFKIWKSIGDSNRVQIIELKKRVLTSFIINTVN